MVEAKLSFEEWAAELKKIYAEQGLTEKQMPDFTYDTWGDYFEDGYTPRGAFEEDLSRAD